MIHHIQGLIPELSQINKLQPNQNLITMEVAQLAALLLLVCSNYRVHLQITLKRMMRTHNLAETFKMS